MRDICKVIEHLQTIIPESETELRAGATAIDHEARYTAPELQQPFWLELVKLLSRQCGSPAGCEWKERVARVMKGEEVVPGAEGARYGDLD